MDGMTDFALDAQLINSFSGGLTKLNSEIAGVFHLSASRLPFHVAMADGKIDGYRGYGPIRGIPATFVLDKQGRIRRKFVGPQAYALFENLIKGLLAE